MKQSAARFRAQERRGLCMRRAELVRRGSCGDAGDGVRGQQERSVEVAKPHRKGRWRGTWLLSKFREQRGVFRARATTVVIADHRCAWKGVSMNRDSLLARFMALGSGEGTSAL